MIQANGPARPPIRVSCIQFAPDFGAVDANLARASDLVRAAAAAGSRLIVLPELASTGYVFESAAEAAALAEPVPEGPTTRPGRRWPRNSACTSWRGSPNPPATSSTTPP